MHDDPELLHAYWAGDADALTRVYVRFGESVSRFVRTGFSVHADGRRVAGERDEAAVADIVHEVFVRAFREPARRAYDGRRPFTPYLLQIAKNVCIDRHRKSRRERLDFVSDLRDLELHQQAALGPVDAPDDDNARFRELSEVTREFVQDLDLEAQRFVELRFQKELSQAVVAEQLGVTRRHVRTLEDRVLKGLRRHLTKRGMVS